MEMPRSLKSREVCVRWISAPLSLQDLDFMRSPRTFNPNVTSIETLAGLDGVGLVEKADEACTCSAGDLVIPMGGDCGTFRTYAILPESKLLVLPKTTVRPDVLSTLMHFICAYQLLQTVEELKP